VYPKLFILKTALASSVVVPCPVPHAELIVYSRRLRGLPVEHWPGRPEWPEPPHLPHEEQSPRVNVDSGASGTSTNSSSQSMYTSSAQVAWLLNDLGNKLIVGSAETARNEPFLFEPPPNPMCPILSRSLRKGERVWTMPPPRLGSFLEYPHFPKPGHPDSNLCHPERSSCFAPRSSYEVEGPAVHPRQDERRKAFSRCSLTGENSLKRRC
jgi:hypothetical protein